MKILIAFYTRGGKARETAKEISKFLKSDLDEIVDKKNRKGIIGWIYAGRDAFKKNLTEIEHKKNPKDYDLVIIGTPVWASTITPAVRTYLTKHKFKKVAFFTTSGSGNIKEAISEMEKLSKKPVAVLSMVKKNFDGETIKIWDVKKIREFCDKIKNEK